MTKTFATNLVTKTKTNWVGRVAFSRTIKINRFELVINGHEIQITGCEIFNFGSLIIGKAVRLKKSQNNRLSTKRLNSKRILGPRVTTLRLPWDDSFIKE